MFRDSAAPALLVLVLVAIVAALSCSGAPEEPSGGGAAKSADAQGACSVMLEPPSYRRCMELAFTMSE
jgi:hypothetical protein